MHQEGADAAVLHATRIAANTPIGRPVFTAGDTRAHYMAPRVIQSSAANGIALALNPAVSGLVPFPWPAPQGAMVLKGKLLHLPFVACCDTGDFRGCVEQRVGPINWLTHQAFLVSTCLAPATVRPSSVF
jgi:hypothetical protein